MAQITIDNITLEAQEGEYILEVARKNGIFIPAICYLSKCSPTLACKLCMVEVEGKRVYACNAKVKDGMQIITNTPEIEIERRAIMQSYAVNHPLECGVCDKSGECELQDFTLMMRVDTQDLFLAPSFKAMDSWAQVKYDPSLCIMCERCVTTCKDNLGEANLKAIKQDSIPVPDASVWKDKMPKDAFSVWNRKQKAIIGFVGSNPCYDCGECASVCPVGALGIKRFQYSTNAWELEKISSTCNLCSSGCKIVYERKKDIDGKMKIYRVSNDFNFNPICSAGRFAYDIGVDSSSNHLQTALNAIKNASYINVGGNITNNEARFLFALKKHFGLKLYNPVARKYQRFLDLALQRNITLSPLDDIANAKAIFSIGSSLKYDNPLVRFKINNALKMQKDSCLIYVHSLEDSFMATLGKNYLKLRYTPNAEIVSFIALFAILDSTHPLLQSFKRIQVEHKSTKEVKTQIREIITDENGNEIENLKEQVEKQEYIENREYFEILQHNGIPYEVYLSLESTLSGKIPLIIIGEDIYNSLNYELIIHILAHLQNLGKIKLLCIPPQANSNGIYLNMEVDSSDDIQQGSSIGFRASGDFVFDSVNADYVIPYFNALDDSMTNIDFRILPLHCALEARDNHLVVLARELGIEGFEVIKQDLPNSYHNSGRDERGYVGEANAKGIDEFHYDLLSCEVRLGQDSTPNAYLRDVSAHFYPYTKWSRNFQTHIGVYVSKAKFEYLSEKLGLNEGEEICLIGRNTEAKIVSKIYVDNDMQDEFFAISPQIDNALLLFGDTRFCEIVEVRKPEIANEVRE